MALSGGLSLAHAQGSMEGLKKVQRDVPAFDLRDTTDVTWSPNSLKGKPWIINFWATWCAPCIEEMPAMNTAWQKLEDQEVGMLAINAGEGLPAVEEFLAKLSIDFPVLLGDGASTLPNWSVMGLPTTVVVDTEGKVVYEAVGPREWDDDELLQQVLDLR